MDLMEVKLEIASIKTTLREEKELRKKLCQEYKASQARDKPLKAQLKTLEAEEKSLEESRIIEAESIHSKVSDKEMKELENQYDVF